MTNKTKDIQRLMPQKPQQPKPLTQEEKAQQIARFLSQKREQYFQIILGGMIHAGAEPKQAVDLALDAADYAMQKLYAPAQAEPKEEEKAQ